MAILFPASPTNGQSVVVQGRTYVYSASKNAWQVTNAGGLTEAPQDGTGYMRKDSGWVPVLDMVGKIQLTISVPDTMTASQVLLRYVASVPLILPINLTGSQGNVIIGPEGDTTFVITVNGVSKGSMSIAAYSTTATFVWASPVALDAGDVLMVYAPDSVDLTSGVAINILAYEGVPS